MSQDRSQFGRKASLTLVQGEQALDLSQFRFTFRTAQADIASPNNCQIRVFNLTEDTMRRVQSEYSRVIVQAGYDQGAFGVIFDGEIRQWRIGRASGTENYLDILAADGDKAFINAVVNTTLEATANTQANRVKAINEAFAKYGVRAGYQPSELVGGTIPSPRGKVMFGLARVMMNAEMQTAGATWSIQNGKLNTLALDGYLPGEAVVLTARTGLIGRPEQTAEGVKVKCLLNPKLTPGGLVKIDNASINRTSASASNPVNTPFNQRTGFQFLATVAADGVYRLFVCEHVGDTRGQDWYSELVCLSVGRDTGKVKPYG